MESGPSGEKYYSAKEEEGKRKRSEGRGGEKKGKEKREREREHTLNKRINPPVARRER